MLIRDQINRTHKPYKTGFLVGISLFAGTAAISGILKLQGIGFVIAALIGFAILSISWTVGQNRVKCPKCGSKLTENFPMISSFLSLDIKDDIRYCKSCGADFQDPIEAQLTGFKGKRCDFDGNQ